MSAPMSFSLKRTSKGNTQSAAVMGAFTDASSKKEEDSSQPPRVYSIPLPEIYQKRKQTKHDAPLTVRPAVNAASVPEVVLKPGLVIMPPVAAHEDDYIDGDVPLLLLNKQEEGDAAEGEKHRFRNDLQRRPDSCNDLAYEQMPVEEFGKAMLVGMGWSKGAKIGRGVNAAAVEPIEYIARPQRRGLDAAPPDKTGEPESKRRKRIKKPGEKPRERPMMQVAGRTDGPRHYRKVSEQLVEVVPLSMAPKALVGFIGGAHKGLLGRVLAVEADRATVRLSGGADVVAEKSACLLLPDILNKEGGVAEIKRRMQEHMKSSEGDSGGQKRKQGKKKKSKKEKPSKKKRVSVWLRPGLVVRCVDKKVQGGKLYQHKLLILDMVTPSSASAVLLEHRDRIVDSVRQSMVQTALPKVGGKVMVVQGEHAGSVGELKQRKSKKNQVQVMLDDTYELVSLTFADVAQYIAVE